VWWSGSTLEASPRDDWLNAEPEGRNVLTSESQRLERADKLA
jgi:hypothetical protein